MIPLIDSLDDSARVIDSVNTIVNTNGRLRGFNTDYSAVVTLLRERAVATDAPFAVLGSGGMARAVVAALRDRGITEGRGDRAQRAGRAGAGRRVRVRLGARGDGHQRPRLLVNATPVGMAGGPDVGRAGGARARSSDAAPTRARGGRDAAR